MCIEVSQKTVKCKYEYINRVKQDNSTVEEAVPDPTGPGMQIPVAPSKGEKGKQSVGGVRGAHHNAPHTPQTQLVYGGEKSTGDALGSSQSDIMSERKQKNKNNPHTVKQLSVK